MATAGLTAAMAGMVAAMAVTAAVAGADGMAAGGARAFTGHHTGGVVIFAVADTTATGWLPATMQETTCGFTIT